MTETEYLLVVLAEECAEVAQCASKALRFGLSDVKPGETEDNLRRLERELADLIAVSEMLGLRPRAFDKVEKLMKVQKFMEYSRQVGTLERGKNG